MSNPKYDEILTRIKKANGLLVETHPTATVNPLEDTGKPKSAPGNANTSAGTNAEVPTNKVEKLASMVSAAVDQLKALQAEPVEAKSAAAESILTAVKQAKTEKKEASKVEELPGTFTPEFHFKLAQAMLETEEGVALATHVLEKKAGVEAAQTLIKEASAEAQAMQSEDALVQAALADLLTAQEYEKFAAGLMGAMGAEEGAIPEGAMPEGALPEGAMPEGVEAGEAGDVTAEEVMEALTQLIDSGEITEEQAQEIVNELSGDEATGDGEFTEEEMEAALSQLIESGEVSPEDLEALMGSLGGEEGGEPAAPVEAPAAV